MTQQSALSELPQWSRGDRLNKALSHAGLSVAAMADYLGVSRNTVGNYINDRTRIPHPTLMLWALKTGVPMEWLEGQEPPVEPTPPPSGRRGVRDEAGLARMAEERSRRSRRPTHEYVTEAA